MYPQTRIYLHYCPALARVHAGGKTRAERHIAETPGPNKKPAFRVPPKKCGLPCC